MIAYIKGTIAFLGDKHAIVDVSGIGYKVFVSADTLHSLASVSPEDIVTLWTYQAVREDVLDLYGFMSQAEVEFFEMLIGISGVGPKSALGIVNVAPLDTLKTAIASGDTGYLTKVSGIGKKNAAKIILELRDKLGAIEGSTVGGVLQEETDVLEALTSLGYSTVQARDVLKKIPKEIKGTGNRIKEALKQLGTNA